MRRFQKDYYQAFPWIEWSESTNRVFCYYCRHFCIDIGPSAKMAFTHDGYQKYDTIREALKTYQISQAHTTAATMYSEFKSRVDTDSSIVALLHKNRSQQVAENRNYIKDIALIVLYLAGQGLAFRGHCESQTGVDNSGNLVYKGNFLQTVDLVSKFGETLRRKIKNSPKNASHF